MGKKTKYTVRYRTEARPKGTTNMVHVDAESESDAIEKVRRQHPKATEIVAKPT